MGRGAGLSRVVSRGWLLGVTDLGSWDRIALDELASLFAGVAAPWWLAGGYAVELAVGAPFREHGDVDVLALRSSLEELRQSLSGWDLHAADPPGTLRPWPASEVLPAHVHDVFCRRTPSSPWAFQFMVDDTDGDDWLFRRDHRVRRRVTSLAGPASRPGLPVLAPEVQLLYKSGVSGGSGRRPKDEMDRDHLGPLLDGDARAWLVGSLSLLEPDHPWLRTLR